MWPALPSAADARLWRKHLGHEDHKTVDERLAEREKQYKMRLEAIRTAAPKAMPIGFDPTTQAAMVNGGGAMTGNSQAQPASQPVEEEVCHFWKIVFGNEIVR